MTVPIMVEIEIPASMADFRLPSGVQRRLQTLLDRQDAGQPLTSAEQEEAQGLVDLAERLSLLRLKTQRVI